MLSKNFFSSMVMFTFIICPFIYSQSAFPYYLSDRGRGIPTSMFGTYINKGEFMFYPFYEFYYNHDNEYKPAELGYGLDQDYLALHRAHEGLVFLGYGITDKLAVELEASVITAKQYKSDEDPSSMPAVLEESGIGDVESQFRLQWNNETEKNPAVFSFLETVFPVQKKKKLIGTQDWEFKLGSGLIKGFKWGTVTLRAAVEYSMDESKLDIGEYAVEYLKRISELVRLYFGVEGSQDEIELISDLQFHVADFCFIRINNAFGITPKAADYAPEAGILFHF